MHAGILQRKKGVTARSDKASAIRSLSNSVVIINRVRPTPRIHRISVIEQIGGSAAGDVEVCQCREHVFSEGLQGNQTRVRLNLIGRNTGIVKVCEYLRSL